MITFEDMEGLSPFKPLDRRDAVRIATATGTNVHDVQVFFDSWAHHSRRMIYVEGGLAALCVYLAFFRK